jgi:hypothetical protein
LLFFETTALSALVFGPATLARDMAAAIALTGAVLTKVEGLGFALAVVGVAAAVQSTWVGRLRVSARLGALPLLSVASWALYCSQHGILQTYGSPGPLIYRYLGIVLWGMLASAAYGSFYAPWLVVAALWIRGRGHSATRVVLPVGVGAGCLALNVYYYLHGSVSPVLWVAWSAERTLVTPLLCLFVGAAARALPPRAL